MSRFGRQLLAWSGFGAVLVGFWALMSYTIPTREQMLKRLPDEVSSQMAETEKKNAQIMEALKDTAKSSEPVWMMKDKNNSDRATQNSKSNA